MRDLTTGTPLYTAVDGLRTLTAGTTLTNTVIGLRDLTAAGGTLVATVKDIRDFSPTAYAGYTTLNGLKSLTSGTVLTDAVNDHALRLLAAENLNGTPTTLTNTVKQVRDLTTGTLLYTAVNNMRTLVAGTTLTNTLIALRDVTGTSAMVTSVKSLQTGAACCGTTTPGSTNWVVYGTSGATNFVDVSIASCGFTSVPSLMTSLTGSGGHFMTIGQTSVYATTAISFRLYVTSLGQTSGTVVTSPMTPAAFNTQNWVITWCAFG